MAKAAFVSSSAHCGVVPPPKGVLPDCVHPVTKTANNIALHTILLLLATSSLLVRLYTRRYIIHGMGLDDYLCILGYILLVAYSALLLACGKVYLGHHIWDVTKDNYVYGHTLEVVSQWLYCFISPTLKLSALWLYRRIFGPQTRVNYIINGGIVFNIIAYTGLFFISLLTCMPFERRFNPFVEGHCLPGGVSAYLSGAINVFTDAFVVLLPIPVIGRLNMAKSQKARAFALFGVGLIVLALSITRLAKTPMIFKKTDATWELSNFAIYSILELYFGLMCTCFLASPSFLDRFVPKFVRRIRSYASSLRLTTSTKTEETHLDDVPHGQSNNIFVHTTVTSGGFPSQIDRKSENRDKDSTSSLQPFTTV